MSEEASRNIISFIYYLSMGVRACVPCGLASDTLFQIDFVVGGGGLFQPSVRFRSSSVISSFIDEVHASGATVPQYQLIYFIDVNINKTK